MWYTRVVFMFTLAGVAALRPSEGQQRQDSSLAQTSNNTVEAIAPNAAWAEAKERARKALSPEGHKEETALRAAAKEVQDRRMPHVVDVHDSRLVSLLVAVALGVIVVAVLVENCFAFAKDLCFRSFPFATTVCFLLSLMVMTEFYSQQRLLWKLMVGIANEVPIDVAKDSIIIAALLMASATAITLAVNFIAFFAAFMAQHSPRQALFGVGADMSASCCLRCRHFLLGNALTQLVVGGLWLAFLAALAASYIAAATTLAFILLRQTCKTVDPAPSWMGLVTDFVATKTSFAGGALDSLNIGNLCPLIDPEFDPVKCIVSVTLCVVVQAAMLSLAARDRARIKDEIRRAQEDI